MNRAENVARIIYERNRAQVERDGYGMNILELARIAREQDQLYKIIFRRWDRRMFSA